MLGGGRGDGKPVFLLYFYYISNATPAFGLTIFPEITWSECDNVTASSGGETEARVPVQESSGGQASHH